MRSVSTETVLGGKNCHSCHGIGVLEEFCAIDESLVFLENPLSFFELRASENIDAEDAARSVGIFGTSPALRMLLDKIGHMANGIDPVVFSGPGGSGKRTFATLFHRLASHGTAAHAAVDCREPHCCLQDISLFSTPRNSFGINLRPSLTIMHPETLSRKLHDDLFAAIGRINGMVRFQFTVDKSRLQKFLRKVPVDFRRILEGRILQVPSINFRRADLRAHILLRLGELNRR
jgi:hypothetical protein